LRIIGTIARPMRANLRAISSSLLTAAVAGSLFAIVPQHAVAQDQPAAGRVLTPLQFDVASIRERNAGESYEPVSVGFVLTPGRIYDQCLDLRALLFFAYDVNWGSQISGLPDWAEAPCGNGKFANTYEFQAELPVEATKEQARQMMQSLLADRFKLAIHWDKKVMPVYDLVVSSSGFKLKPIDPGVEAPGDPNAYRCPGDDRRCHSTGFSGPIGGLAGNLALSAGRPVVDKTGIAGNYEAVLKWASDTATDSTLPSLPAALKEKFGLELKADTAPVDVLVIDHVEKPTPN
jgi:uncharacterized protein (TIGR03435 family)